MANNIKRYYSKHIDFFDLLQKIKLWPSKNGTLHGIKKIEIKGNYAEITTHCNEKFIVKKSKKSHAARWMRNKWYRSTCKKCKIPSWKLEKYSTTGFNQNYGAGLININNTNNSN
jgi:pyrrolysyl-tRNA synthetase-like protein